MADWFDENSPEPPQRVQPATAAEVAAFYPQLLGRAPESDDIIQSWVNGVGQNGIEAVRAAIAGSPEAKAFAARPPAPGAPPPPAQGGDAALRAQIAQWAAMPGADPSLAKDPDYWVGAINSRGGLTDANRQYWQDASVGPTAFFNNPNREAGNAPAGSPLSAMGVKPPPDAPAATTFQPPTAPVYNNYTPTQAPAVIPFTAPTQADARNSPGFQSAIETADQGIQRSSLSKSGLSGGLLKDIGAYNIGLADQNYQNVFGNALASNQANNGQALNSWVAQNNAGLGAASLNLAGTNQQFQNTYQPNWAAYQSNVGQQQFGANYGLNAANFGLNANQQQFGQTLARDQFNLGAQNQNWTQGFNENRNAFDQYNTNQNSAFDQWFKLYQSGNPGNPYV